MTLARSGGINKDNTSILDLLKNYKFLQTLRYSFNRGNSNSKILYRSVCDAETFNDQINIPESSLYMSPLRAIVLSQQYCRITVIW